MSLFNLQLFTLYSEKLNAKNYYTAVDISSDSFKKFRAKTKDDFSYLDAKKIHNEAEKYTKKLGNQQLKVLRRAAPQLQTAMSAVQTSRDLITPDYENLFGRRAEQYAPADSIASRFSPTAYLTELYREAKELHGEGMPEHIDVRRPDIGSLILNQAAQDETLSTLSMANEVIKASIGEADIEKTLSETQGSLFHFPFERVQSVMMQKGVEAKEIFETVGRSHWLESQASLNLKVTLKQAGEFKDAFRENTTEEEYTVLLEQYYGTSDTSHLSNIEHLCALLNVDKTFLTDYLLGTYVQSSNVVGGHAVSGRQQGLCSSLGVSYQTGSVSDSNGGQGQVLINNEDTLYILPFSFPQDSHYKFVCGFDVLPSSESGKVTLSVATKTHNYLSPEKIKFNGIVVGDSPEHENEYVQVTVPSAKGEHSCNIRRSGWHIGLDINFDEPVPLTADVLVKLYQLVFWHKALDLPLRIVDDVMASYTKYSLTSSVTPLSVIDKIGALIQTGFESEDAAVLVGLNIGAAQFALLFNQSVEEGFSFTIDESSNSMSYDPSDTVFVQYRNVLKGAFGVDDNELGILARISQSASDNSRSLKNISALYRACLMTQWLQVRPTELEFLLQAYPNKSKYETLWDAGWYRQLCRLESVNQWVLNNNLDYIQLNMMTSSLLSNQVTDQMKLFWGSIYQSMSGKESFDFSKTLSTEIKNQFSVPSERILVLVLDWVTDAASYYYQGFTITTLEQFWQGIHNYANGETCDLSGMAMFTNAIAQFLLVIDTFDVTLEVLEPLVKKNSGYLDPVNLFRKLNNESGRGYLALGLDSLQGLSRVKNIRNLLGELAPVYTSLFGEDILTQADVLSLLKGDYPENEIIQVCEFFDTENKRLDCLDEVINLLDFSKTQKLSVAALVALTDVKESTTYEEWSALANQLEASLSALQQTKHKNKVDESLSQALCGYFLANKSEAVTSFDLNDREDLYRYLLIDNKVSGEILTTRVAESIASLQLYVNKCIQGFELNIDHELLIRPFFEHWSRYNNRYSTWAGLEKLTFYPENYVEPTLRYNQTRLQQGLLSDISQNQLSDDAVDDAYRRYLSQFEEVANLGILGGYLHGNDFNLGDSYFVARSKEKPHRYYWRSLDNTASDGMGGYVASAWSEWEEITAPMTPLRDQMRLVMFQDRLYISWIEAMESAEADSSGETIKSKTSYQLKLSYRKIDGTWAAALDYPLNIPSSLIDTFNLYSTYHSETESMLFMLYNPNKVPAYYDGIGTQGNGEGPAYGGFIGADLQFNEKAASDEGWKDIYVNFENNLNTSKVKNKVIRYVPDAYYEYETPLKLLSPDTDEDGIVSNVSIDEQYIDNDDIPADFCCKTSALVSPSKKVKQVYLGDSGTVTNLVVTDESKVSFTFKPSGILYSILYNSDNVTRTAKLTRVTGVGYLVELDLSSSGRVTKIDVAINTYTIKSTYKPPVLYPGSGNVSGSWTHHKVFKRSTLTLSSDISMLNEGGNWVDLPLFPRTQKVEREFSYKLRGGALVAQPSLIFRRSDKHIYKQKLDIRIDSSANVNPTDNMLIVNDSNGACYLELTNKARRIRLNTLFSKELISRARLGLGNVLSWESQQLAEPKLGKGSYIDVTLPPYNPKQHGSGEFVIYTVGVNHFRSQAKATSGKLLESAPTTVKVFLPYSGHYHGSENRDERNRSYIGITFDQSDLGGTGTYLVMDAYNWDSNKGTYKIGTRNLKGARSQVSEQQTEPMDFSGANSLYFWELFYYTPMMVVDRLLQSQAFESAERWLKYVFNPSGYYEKSLQELKHTGRQWNMRPLQEDTAWDDDNVDTTDPDIVAQADPMHYKVATYMKLLDLLIARGDMAYRRLERDTLNEAKMWYSVAKNLLGDTSESTSVGDWSDLPLNVVADKEVQKAALKAMDQIMAGQASQASYDEQVKALFYPTGNDKLTGYDKTLNQRLFNLRHNLSIDGQPLTLPIYAEPADPKALHRTAAASVNGGYGDMGQASIAIQRFPIMLESARGLVNQLTHYGSSLLSVLEKKDAEGLSLLMQTHAVEVMGSTIDQQSLMVDELKSEQSLLVVNLDRAKASLDTYQTWLKEGVSRAEKDAINTRITAGATTTQANLFRMAGAAIDTAPNVFGFAFGGMQFGALAHAAGAGLDAVASAMVTGAEASEASEQYRRRAQEWESARDDAKLAVKEIKQQQKTLVIRLEAAEMQKSLLETQKLQFNEQLDLMKTKFTNQSLYSWMQGKLSTLYYQFYDLVAMRCLKAQLGYQWETQDTSTFIQPGAWDSHRAGLLCGEALMLNLTQMESTYLDWDSRSLEVNRTVSMLSEMGEGVDFNTEVNRALNAQDPSVSSKHTVVMRDNDVLMATIDLNALNIEADYPDAVVGDNKVRRIKQVSVSLPALLGPYQDIQAVLSYSGNGDLIHQSCKQAAISHGMNDSGQFQLDFNDSRYLPFEGLPIDGNGSASLMLTFPNAGDKGKQRALLESLTDIILHIRYTIGSSK